MSVKDTQHFKKLDQEIEELENMIRGTSSSPEVIVEDTAQVVEDPVEVQEETVPVSGSADTFDFDTTSEEDQGSKRTAWKQEYLALEKRYKKLRSTTDMKLHQLRTEKGDLLNHISFLEGKVNELSNRITSMSDSQDNLLSSYTSDEIDIMGGPEEVEKQLNFTKKVIEQKVKPIQEELERTKEENRKKLAKAAEDEKLKAYNSFMFRLGEMVPEYETINKNPDFLKWLDGYDSESAYSRLERLRSAQRDGDVPMVASFFTRWVESKSNKSNPVLDNKIGVVSTHGSTISTQQGKVEIIPYSVVKKFYDDDAKGRYKNNPRKADELERKYDLARVQGRIDFNR